MNHPSITVVIEGNTYTLKSDELQSMRDMPKGDRVQLIKLLEVLKAQHEKSQRMVQAALVKTAAAGATSVTAGSSENSESSEGGGKIAQPAQRLGKGDVDELMARLIMEERQEKERSRLKPATIYKFMAVVVGIIVVLSLV